MPFPPHSKPDLVDLMAEVYYEWRRDNGAYCKELLELILQSYPWSKEAADFYGVVMSKVHHIYNDVEMVRLHQWMALQQAGIGKPFEIDEKSERMGSMMRFLRGWLRNHYIDYRDVIHLGYITSNIPLEVPQWARIVDIGGHTGEMGINWIGLAGAKDCLVLDIASELLKLGRKFYGDPRLHWATAIAHALPVKTASVDVAILSGILEHVRNPDDLVAEAERIVRPGGIILIQVPYGGMEGPPNPEADKLSFRSHVRCIDPYKYSKGHELLLDECVNYTGNAVLQHALLGSCADYQLAYTR